MSPSQVNAVDARSLWHRRLGHPSNEVLSLLPSSSKGEICEICIRAKQTRTQFPVSKNNAANIFDLIHWDIWGTLFSNFR